MCAVWGPYHHPACIVWRCRCIIHLRHKAHHQKLRKTSLKKKKKKKKRNKTYKKRTAVFIAKKRNKYGKNGTVGISDIHNMLVSFHKFYICQTMLVLQILVLQFYVEDLSVILPSFSSYLKTWKELTWRALESSILAFSAASLTLCSAMVSLVTSMPDWKNKTKFL